MKKLPALMLLTSCYFFSLPFALAQNQIIGDWAVSRSTIYQEAFTANASGSMAGVWCALKEASCFAYFKTANPCIDGRTIPILVSSVVGAVAANSTCVKVMGNNGQPLVFNQVEIGLFTTAAESGSEFAFAIPLMGGQFAVLRFSSGGATDAIRQAMTLPAGAKDTRPRDQVL